MCGSTALWAVTSSAKPLYCLDVRHTVFVQCSTSTGPWAYVYLCMGQYMCMYICVHVVVPVLGLVVDLAVVPAHLSLSPSSH